MFGRKNGTQQDKEAARKGPALPARIERRVRITRLMLVWAALLPALWPAACLAGFLTALALFGVFNNLPLLLHWIILAATGGLFFWLLWYGFRDFRWPDREDALRHLEKSSGLTHAPLSAYEDIPAENNGNPELWEAHRRSIDEKLKKLHIGIPASLLAGRDPYALRAIVLLMLVIGIIGTEPGRISRIAHALFPGTGGEQSATLEAWITPPAYTQKPPLYLAESNGKEAQIISDVPEGSVLSLRIHGLKNAPILEKHGNERDKPQSLETIAPGSHMIDTPLSNTSDVALTEGGRMIRAWRINVTPDAPPQIDFTAPPEQSVSRALRLRYAVEDDYGVVSAEAHIALNMQPESKEPAAKKPTPPQPRVTAPDIRLNLPGIRPREASGETYAELTAHPWAGLPVTITLMAKDDKEQEGFSAPYHMTLPAREFTHPLARAIIEQRRRLALDPRSGLDVARAIDNFTQDAERYIEDYTVYLALRAAYWRLAAARRDTDLTGIFDLLWDVALRLEDGDRTLAERDLRDAQKALADALSRNAGSEEINRLMSELRAAFERYMEALMAEGGDPANSPFPQMPQDGDAMTIERGDLEAMMNAIAELAETGAHEQARALLEQLQNILENMEVPSQADNMSPGEMATAQAIEEVTELIDQQRKLMDETFSKLAPQHLDEHGDPIQPGFPQTSRTLTDLEALAREQGELARKLDDIMQRLKDAAPDTESEALSKAGEAMESAEGRLEAGRADRAVNAQQQALSNLQEGVEGLVDGLMQGRSGQMGGRTSEGGRRDPFGRDGQGSSPSMRRGENAVPAEIDMQNARRILQELRQRAMELDRPQIELDYLDRLLKRF